MPLVLVACALVNRGLSFLFLHCSPFTWEGFLSTVCSFFFPSGRGSLTCRFAPVFLVHQLVHPGLLLPWHQSPLLLVFYCSFFCLEMVMSRQDPSLCCLVLIKRVSREKGCFWKQEEFSESQTHHSVPSFPLANARIQSS